MNKIEFGSKTEINFQYSFAFIALLLRLSIAFNLKETETHSSACLEIYNFQS